MFTKVRRIRNSKLVTLIRKPTVVDVAISLWWVLLVVCGLIGVFGIPSARVTNNAGIFGAQYVMSGTIMLVAVMGFISRFLNARRAEAVFCYGMGILTVLHGTLHIAHVDDVTAGLQTGLRLYAAAVLAFVVGQLITREHQLIVDATGYPNELLDQNEGE